MSKRITDTTGVNNSSKKRKSVGDKQLAAQLVQHRHIEALGDMMNIAQNAAEQLQAEDLSKRDRNAIARNLTSLANAVKNQRHVVTEANKDTSQIAYSKYVHGRLKTTDTNQIPMKPTKRTLLIPQLANHSH